MAVKRGLRRKQGAVHEYLRASAVEKSTSSELLVVIAIIGGFFRRSKVKTKKEFREFKEFKEFREGREKSLKKCKKLFDFCCCNTILKM
jgi:hypothetical protein